MIHPLQILIPTDQGQHLEGWRCSDGREFLGQQGKAQAVEHERGIAKAAATGASH